MSIIKRGRNTFDIDPKSFKLVNLENYLKTYFKEGSLNIASEVPVLILESIPIVPFSGGHFEICVSNKHSFYNIFRDLSKDNISLYNDYFIERWSKSKVKESIKLLVEYDEKHKSKFLNDKRVWCKLDVKVRVIHLEELFYEEDRDSEYVDCWIFQLDLNKIEFV